MFRAILIVFSVSAFRAVFPFLHGVQSHCLFSFRRSELCFVSVWHSEPHLRFDVQSHCLRPFYRSEPCFHSYMAFRAIAYFHFGVQSRVLFLFGVLSHIFVQRSEPLPIFVSAFRVVFCFCLEFRATSSFGVQSHYLPSSRCSEPLHIVRFGIQSHHFSVSAFRAILITFSVLVFRAVIVTSLGFGVQSHYHIFIRRSEPSLSLLSIGVQSHHHRIFGFDIQSHHYRFSISASRAIITHQFDAQSRILGFYVQSHHYSSAWRSESHFQYWRSKPLLVFRSTFRAIICLLLRVQSHILSFSIQSHHRSSVLAFRCHVFVRRSKPCFALFGVQSHYSPSIQCSEPLHIIRFDVQSHVLLRSTFRAISSFGVQSHYIIHFGVQSHVLLRSAFRATSSVGIQIHIFIWRSEPHLHSVFRAIICFLFKVQSCGFQFDTQSPHVYLSFDPSPFSPF